MIPGWVADYVGIPYRAAGRDRATGLDCWGLVRLVAAERFGRDLPDYPGWRGEDDDGAAEATAMAAQGDPRWERLAEGAGDAGDVVLLRIRGMPLHVGILVAPGLVLHAHARADAAVEALDSPRWRHRVLGVFRWRPERVEILPPGPRVAVATPFGRRALPAVPEGASIAAIVAAAGVPAPVVVTVGEVEIAPDWWGRVRPKAGAVVTIRVPLRGGGGGGGGKDILRTVATIAIVAAAGAFVAPAVVGATLGAGATGFGASLITSAVTAGAGLLGSLLINAIAPPPRPQLRLPSFAEDAGPPVYSVSGSANRATPYAPVPVVLGTMRVRPPLGAPQYTEVVGDDQFLRALFVVGYGPLTLSDIWIGDTPITSFDGVETQIREGLAGDAATTLYPGSVTEEALSVDVRGTAGAWSTRRTRTATTEISVDFTAPQGLGWVDASTGARSRLTVRIEIEAAPVSTGVFAAVTTLDLAGSDLRTRRFGHRWTVARGQYDVRVRWVSTTGVGSAAQTVDAITWSALRSINGDDPIRLAGVAKIALRIKGTGQLNGLISELSVLAKARIPTWSGSAWGAAAETRNPAAAFRWLLSGAATKRTVPAGRIDDAGLGDWADFCAGAGFSYDAYWTDGASLADRLREVAAAGRAAPTIRDGRYGVVIDRPQATPVQLFTPRNSWGFSGSRVFPEPPHALKVSFTNRDRAYEADELVVYADGQTAATATRFDRLELPGVTDAAHAFRLARWHLATPTLRPERWTLSADIEALVATRGDLVRIQHDALLVGVGWARVAAVTLDVSDRVTEIVLDTGWTVAAGVRYGLAVRRDIGDLRRFEVTPAAGDGVVTMPVAAPAVGLAAVGDLVAIGELDRETVEAIVWAVEGGPDLSARLTLVPAAPELATVDARPLPAFDPLITQRRAWIAPPPPVPAIDAVRSDESVMAVLSDGTLRTRLVATLRPAASTGVRADAMQARIRRLGGADAGPWRILPALPADVREIVVDDVEDGETVELQVRTLAGTVASAWSGPAVHTIVGQTTLPPDVPTLSIDAARRLSWTYPAPPRDLAGWVVRHAWGPAGRWDAAAPVVDGVVTTQTLDLAGRLPGGTRTILVRAVDRGGRLSAGAAVLVVDLGDDVLGNVVVTDDIGAAGYPGTITGGTVTGGVLQAGGDATLYLPTAAALYLPVDGDLYLPSAWGELRWQATVVPPGDVLPATLSLDLTVAGDGWTVEYRTLGDASYLPDGAALYLPDGAALYLGGPDPWRPWPGTAPARAEGFDVRITVPGGGVRPEISILRAVYDVPDQDEDLQDVAIAAAGTRLPITKRFRSVASVLLTLEQDGGGAVSARILDRDAALGPLVACYDAAGTSVSGTLDARVKGY
jgi:cell wall-associated NlpC family hydrolase